MLGEAIWLHVCIQSKSSCEGYQVLLIFHCSMLQVMKTDFKFSPITCRAGKMFIDEIICAVIYWHTDIGLRWQPRIKEEWVVTVSAWCYKEKSRLKVLLEGGNRNLSPVKWARIFNPLLSKPCICPWETVEDLKLDIGIKLKKKQIKFPAGGYCHSYYHDI